MCAPSWGDRPECKIHLEKRKNVGAHTLRHTMEEFAMYFSRYFMKNKPWIPRAGARGGKGFLSLKFEYNALHDPQTNEPCSI